MSNTEADEARYVQVTVEPTPTELQRWHGCLDQRDQPLDGTTVDVAALIAEMEAIVRRFR